MKKILLLLLSAGFFAASFAQPVVHGYDVNPVIGDTIVLNSYNSPLNYGANGANQTWDFSTLAAQYPIMSWHYISPVGTFNAASFTNANLCAYDSVNKLCFYYYADSSRLNYIGQASSFDTNVYEQYYNAQATYRFPLTYNTHYSDTFSELYISQVLGTVPTIVDTVTITGLSDWNVVGYGTLILPSGAFNNTLKMVITNSDTFYNHRTHNLSIKNFTEVCWFYPGIHTPLLDCFNSRATFLAGTPTAINEIVGRKYKVSCFPNPAQSTVNIGFELKQPCDVTVQVVAANGAVVLKQETRYNQSGTATMPLNIAPLAPGLYVADLNISGVHISQQFIKN